MKDSYRLFQLLVTSSLTLLLLSACRQTRIVRESPRLEFSFDGSASQPTGTWKAKGSPPSSWNNIGQHWHQVQTVNGNQRTYLASVESKELSPLWNSSRSDAFPFSYKQDAGTLVFVTAGTDSSQGAFTLEIDPTFKQLVEKLNGKPASVEYYLMCLLQKTDVQTLNDYVATEVDLSGDQLWSWIRYKVSGEEVMQLKSALEDLKAPDVILLKRYGVKPGYVTKLALHYPKFNAEDYTKIRRYGVNESYALKVAESERSFSADDLVQLRRYGVPESWPAACDAFEKIKGVDDLVLMRRYGVNLDFLKAALRNNNVQSAQDIVTLRRRGVSTDFIGDLEAAEAALTIDEIIQLKYAGVTADYFVAAHALGNYSVQDIIQFRRRGVNIDLIKAANPPDRKPMSVDAIIELRNRGVSPKSVRELRQ